MVHSPTGHHRETGHYISPFFDGKETNHVRFDLRQSISTKAAYQIRNGSRYLSNLTSAAGSDALVHQWLPVAVPGSTALYGSVPQR